MRAEQLLSESAERLRDKPAIVAAGRSQSYADLDTRSDRLAREIAARGVRHGDRVAVFLDDAHAAAVSAFAVFKAGAVLCPIDPALQPEDLSAILTECRAVGIVTEARLASAAALALCKVAAVRLVVLVGGERSAAQHGCISFEDAVARPFGAPARAAGGGEAAIVFRSGWTDQKFGAVPLGHGELVAAASAEPHGAAVVEAPMWTGAGLCRLVGAIAAGVTLDLGSRMSARAAPFGADGRDVRLALVG